MVYEFVRVEWRPGVIFLIDPVCLTPPRDREWRPARHADGIQRRNQANLLNACINLIPPDRQGEVPFAIAVSKADLVSEYLTYRPGVDQDREVRALLEMCDAHGVQPRHVPVAPPAVSATVDQNERRHRLGRDQRCFPGTPSA
ncbi:hypothetical protein F8568_032055 [Actinomadura sp. LD22]|uniref:Uncharacterized protein n=1 Tax=Actinomadura physcomitrii TaxID=2650748 RepID=A0A6I4MJ43_9ACTN|nr:hypothetical protein [Actinomadura physcomitrii]MWA04920.1 hypothetical protein [Actinomadura physcomitrii]